MIIIAPAGTVFNHGRLWVLFHPCYDHGFWGWKSGTHPGRPLVWKWKA